MTADHTAERIKRIQWDRYEAARRAYHASQTEHEAMVASQEAASAWAAWIVAHNPTCPSCGAKLEVK